MMNDLPTIFEVVTGAAKKQVKDKSTVTNHNGNKSKSNSKGVREVSSSFPELLIKFPSFPLNFWNFWGTN